MTTVLLGIPSGWLSGYTPGLSSTEASSGHQVGGALGLSLVISVPLSLVGLRLFSFLFVSSLFLPLLSLSFCFAGKSRKLELFETFMCFMEKSCHSLLMVHGAGRAAC